MPDLNLQEDEGALQNPEGSPEGSGEMMEVTEEAEAPKESKGGLLKVLIIVGGVLVIGGGGVFLLNKLGIVKLWGAKAPTVTEIQESTYPESAPQEAGAVDTAQPQMIETPALEEPAKAATEGAAKPTRPAETSKAASLAAAGTKLTEMKGEYTVQVSAWRSKETAQEMVTRLADAGYPAYVGERSYKDGTWYTVRIGRYPSRKEAQLAVENFGEELKANHWIDRVRGQ
jgi:cell division protein FtsN